MFFQMLFDRIRLLRSVHTGGKFIGENDAKTGPVFKRAELLQ